MCASGNTEGKNENINLKIYNISSFQDGHPQGETFWPIREHGGKK